MSTSKLGIPNLWIAGLSVGLLGCVGGAAYSVFQTELNAGTMVALGCTPILLGVAALTYRLQKRRMQYTEQGVADITSALEKIAEGDLTVMVTEDNSVTRDIARQINASTQRQRELIRNIKTPFSVSTENITRIGAIAEGQVDKGRELTRSVVESTTAATDFRWWASCSWPWASNALPARASANCCGHSQQCRFSSSGLRWLNDRNPPNPPGDALSRPTTLPLKGLLPSLQ